MIERIKQFIKQYTEKEKQKAEDIGPMQVSIETAINNGYTPCGRCY